MNRVAGRNWLDGATVKQAQTIGAQGRAGETVILVDLDDHLARMETYDMGTGSAAAR